MKKNKKILLAEDNTFLAKLTSNHLKCEGFDIDVAVDGNETLDKMKDNSYAMLLLDLIMPNKDGFEVLKQLRGWGNKTPVFVFSNLAQAEDKEEALKLGAQKFFAKDEVVFDDLIREIKNIIGA